METKSNATQQEHDEIEKPLPELIDWLELPIGCLIAVEVRNHPRLGTNKVSDFPINFISTSRVQWLNRETRLVQTQNTLYRLGRELKKD